MHRYTLWIYNQLCLAKFCLFILLKLLLQNNGNYDVGFDIM